MSSFNSSTFIASWLGYCEFTKYYDYWSCVYSGYGIAACSVKPIDEVTSRVWGGS